MTALATATATDAVANGAPDTQVWTRGASRNGVKRWQVSAYDGRFTFEVEHTGASGYKVCQPGAIVQWACIKGVTGKRPSDVVPGASYTDGSAYDAIEARCAWIMSVEDAVRAHQEAKTVPTRAEYVAIRKARNEDAPEDERTVSEAKLFDDLRSGRRWKAPTRRAFAPKRFEVGDTIGWTSDGIEYTGQVWSQNTRHTGQSGYTAEGTCVVVATRDGKEAVHGSVAWLYTGRKYGKDYARIMGDDAPRSLGPLVEELTLDDVAEAPAPAKERPRKATKPRQNAQKPKGGSQGVTESETAPAERVRPSAQEGWENGRTAERAAVLKGWVTTADAEDYAERFPQCVEVYDRFERYEGEFRRSPMLTTVHASGVEFPARWVFDEDEDRGITITLPNGTLERGNWGYIARTVRAYVLAHRPEHVVAVGESFEKAERIIAERKAEDAREEAAGLRALDEARTNANRARAAFEALLPHLHYQSDEAEEAVYEIANEAARNAEVCERVARNRDTYRWWSGLVGYADAVRRAADWLIRGVKQVGATMPEIPQVVSVAPDAAPSDPGAADTWEGEGGAVAGVDTPRGPEAGPTAGGFAPLPGPGGAPEVPLPAEFDVNASMKGSAPAGEGANSGKLDADAPKEREGAYAAEAAPRPATSAELDASTSQWARGRVPHQRLWKLYNFH